MPDPVSSVSELRTAPAQEQVNATTPAAATRRESTNHDAMVRGTREQIQWLARITSDEMTYDVENGKMVPRSSIGTPDEILTALRAFEYITPQDLNPKNEEAFLGRVSQTLAENGLTPEQIPEALEPYKRALAAGRKISKDYSKDHFSNASVYALSDEQAREAMTRIYESLPEDGIGRRMINQALSDPNFEVRVIGDYNVNNFRSNGNRLSQTIGLQFASENAIAFAALADEHTEAVIEEVSHKLIDNTYKRKASGMRMNAAAFEDPRDQRAMLLNEAIAKDFKNSNGYSAKLLAEIGAASYDHETFVAEIPAKVLTYKILGKWTSELAQKFSQIDHYVDHVVIPDIESLRTGTPLSTPNVETYRATLPPKEMPEAHFELVNTLSKRHKNALRQEGYQVSDTEIRDANGVLLLKGNGITWEMGDEQGDANRYGSTRALARALSSPGELSDLIVNPDFRNTFDSSVLQFNRALEPQRKKVQDAIDVKSESPEAVTLRKAPAAWMVNEDGSMIIKGVPNSGKADVIEALHKFGIESPDITINNPKSADIHLSPEQARGVRPYIEQHRLISTTPSPARKAAMETSILRGEVTDQLTMMNSDGDSRSIISNKQPVLQFRGDRETLDQLRAKLSSLNIPSEVGTLRDGDTVLQISRQSNIDRLAKIATMPLELEKIPSEFAPSLETDAMRVMMRQLADNGDIRIGTNPKGATAMQIRGSREALEGLQKTLNAELKMPEGHDFGTLRYSKSGNIDVLELSGNEVALYQKRFSGLTDSLTASFSKNSPLLVNAVDPDDTAVFTAPPKQQEAQGAQVLPESGQNNERSVVPETQVKEAAPAAGKPSETPAAATETSADQTTKPSELAKLDKANGPTEAVETSTPIIAHNQQYAHTKQLLRMIDQDPSSIRLAPDASQLLPQVAEYQRLAAQAQSLSESDPQQANTLRQRMGTIESQMDADFNTTQKQLRSQANSQTRLTGMSIGQNGLGLIQSSIALQNIDSTPDMSETERTVRKAMAWTQMATSTAGIAVDARSLANPATKLGAGFGAVAGGIGVVTGTYDFVQSARARNTEGMVLSGANVGASGMGVASSYITLTGGSAATATALGVGAAATGAVLSGYYLRSRILENTAVSEQRDTELEATQSRESQMRRPGVTPNFGDAGLPLKPEFKEYKELLETQRLMKREFNQDLLALADSPERLDAKLKELSINTRNFAHEHLPKAQAQIDNDSRPLLQPFKFVAEVVSGHDFDAENQKYMDKAFLAKEVADRTSSARRELRGDFAPDGTQQPRGYTERMKQYQEVLQPLEKEYPQQVQQLTKLGEVYKVISNSGNDWEVVKVLGIQDNPQAREQLTAAYKLPEKERLQYIAEAMAKKNFQQEMSRVEAMSSEEQQAYFGKNKEFIAKAKLEGRDDLSLAGLTSSPQEYLAKKIQLAPATLRQTAIDESKQLTGEMAALGIERKQLAPLAEQASQIYAELTGEKPKPIPVLDENGEPVLRKDGQPKTVDDLKTELAQRIQGEQKQLDAMSKKLLDGKTIDRDSEALAQIKQAAIDKLQHDLMFIERNEMLHQLTQTEQAKRSYREQTAALFEKAGDQPIALDDETRKQVKDLESLSQAVAAMRTAQHEGKKVDLKKLAETEKKLIVAHRELGEKIAGGENKQVMQGKDAPEQDKPVPLTSYDRDHNGVLSTKEAKNVRERDVDTDGDGKVSRVEFSKIQEIASSGALKDIVGRMQCKLQFDETDLAGIKAQSTPMAMNAPTPRGLT